MEHTTAKMSCFARAYHSKNSPCPVFDDTAAEALLGADFVNTENLKGLDKLLGRRFTFVTLPLKFENADGCSCRAIALEE